jgi:heme/copper-type cytochrome/quinol oxidase subunit 4
MNILDGCQGGSEVMTDLSAPDMPLLHEATVQEPLNLPDRWITRYALFTPVLWVLGILLPAGILLLLWMLVRNRLSQPVTDKVVLSWLLVACTQALALLINWLHSSFSAGFFLRQLVSTTTGGWLVLAAVLAAGRYAHLKSENLIRSSAILAVYIIMLSVLAYGAYYVAHFDVYLRPSLLAHVLGSIIPPNTFHFSLSLATLSPDETIFGLEIPRLILFFPWALILGFAGIGIFFITIHEPNPFWKTAGIAGALTAIIGSLGRISVAAFIMSLVFYLWMKSKSGHKWLLVSMFSVLIMLTVLIVGADPFEIMANISNSLLRSRPYSTDVRMLLNEETWKGIMESPIIGIGWQGERVFEDVPMPIGSHSTILGTLYTGGILTFGAFCLAVVITFLSLLKRSLNGDSRHTSALAIFFALMVFTYTESIQLFIFPNLIIFFWIGWALSSGSEDAERESGSIECADAGNLRR